MNATAPPHITAARTHIHLADGRDLFYYDEASDPSAHDGETVADDGVAPDRTATDTRDLPPMPGGGPDAPRPLDRRVDPTGLAPDESDPPAGPRGLPPVSQQA